MCYTDDILVEESDTDMGGKLNVLLIESNAGDAYMLKAMLADANGHVFKVDWADTLESGLSQLNTQKYDAVLMDLFLTDSKGLETLARLNGQILSVPVLVLAKEENDELGRKVVQEGAQDYLLKNRLSSDLLRQSILYGVERQHLVEKIRSESIKDDLTKLYNRRGFLMLAKQQLKIVHRHKRLATMLFIDLDNLKNINDNLGHQYGDLAIIEVAGLIKELFRDSDIIGRMGGDEFAVFAIGVNTETAEIIAARLANRLEEKNSRYGRMYDLSVSVGIAPYSTEKDYDVKELLSLADALMYRHKSGKKEQVPGAICSVTSELN